MNGHAQHKTHLLPTHTHTLCRLLNLTQQEASKFSKQTRSNALDPAQLNPEKAKRIVANRQVRVLLTLAVMLGRDDLKLYSAYGEHHSHGAT
jgi:hypothetical protein